MMTLRFLILSTLALAGPAAAKAAPTRPNIVFIYGDDWGRYAGAYRDPQRPTPNDVIQTPVFDSLAGNGILFMDAHVSAPSCTPSRGAVLTGRHFYRNGSASQLHHPWMHGYTDPVLKIPSYHNLLEKAGYHCGMSYKTHVPANLYGGNKRVFNKAGGRFNRYSMQLVDAPDVDAKRAELLAEVRGNLSDFLNAGAENQPFCWWFSPTQSHRDWAEGSAQKLWKLNPDSLKGKLPAFLPDVPQIRQDFADYLGTCMAMDEALGVIIAELKKRDQFDNTLIVISGDHGAPGFPRGKCNLYTFGTQVPLAIHWPKGIVKPGRRIDNPTSLIHLAPTFLEAAGIAPDAGMNGKSLMPVLTGDASGTSSLIPDFVITGREIHVPGTRKDQLPYPSRSLRTAGFQYIRNFAPDRWPITTPPLGADQRCDMDRGPTQTWFAAHQAEEKWLTAWNLGFAKRPLEELYDLTKEPDQMHNLATDPAHAGTREKMSARLMVILKETEDPRVAGEGNAFDRPPYHNVNRKR